MSNVIINAVTYDGTPTAPTNPYKPNKITRPIEKIGTLHRAADGTTTWIHRGIKRVWALEWDRASPTTETALAAVRALTTTFSFTDVNAVAYTVVNVGDDPHDSEITTDRNNNYRYSVTLTLREA